MSNFQTFELWVSIYSVRANFGPAAAGSAGPVPTPLILLNLSADSVQSMFIFHNSENFQLFSDVGIDSGRIC